MTPELRAEVFARDLAAVADDAGLFGFSVRWRDDRAVVLGTKWGPGQVICPAVLIEPAQFGKCEGRWTIEHVKDQARLGVRASSDLAHCLALCEGHTENGMKGGVIWNTAHRPELRAYLWRFA